MAKRRKGRNAVARKAGPRTLSAAERANNSRQRQPRTAQPAAAPRNASPLTPTVIAVGLLAVIVLVIGYFYFTNDGGDDPDPTPVATESLAQIPAATPLASLSGACWNEAPGTTAGYPQWTTAPNQVINPGTQYSATIRTSAGPIVVDLDAAAAPTAVNSFVCLSQAGYYTNVPFHRILSGFVIQSGDPTGTGTGGPGYQFADELPTAPTPYTRGTLAMANSGPNTNGSQFFIMHQDQDPGFPSSYTIFGRVTSGIEVVDAIAATPVGANAQGEMSVPQTPVTIQSVTITER